jgi:hypothetical protein
MTATVIVAFAVAAGVSGCGGGRSATGASGFDDQANKTVACMAHQSAAPGSVDRPGKSEDPESVLAYLHYYTANGDRPYCDGKPATAVDRQWLALYLAGGAARSHVEAALAAG